MTLSFDAISRARSIAILMVGAGKVTLIERVAECLRSEELCDLPLDRLIRYVSVGQLAVYITSTCIVKSFIVLPKQGTHNVVSCIKIHVTIKNCNL